MVVMLLFFFQAVGVIGVAHDSRGLGDVYGSHDDGSGGGGDDVSGGGGGDDDGSGGGGGRGDIDDGGDGRRGVDVGGCRCVKER